MANPENKPTQQPNQNRTGQIDQNSSTNKADPSRGGSMKNEPAQTDRKTSY